MDLTLSFHFQKRRDLEPLNPYWNKEYIVGWYFQTISESPVNPTPSNIHYNCPPTQQEIVHYDAIIRLCSESMSH